MEHKNYSKVVPLNTPEGFKWVNVETAARMAKNGRGITIGRMMNKIYAGELNGYVYCDHLGSWWVLVPEFITQNNPLRAA